MLKCESCHIYRKDNYIWRKCPKCKQQMKSCQFKEELLGLLSRIADNTMRGG